MRRLELTGHGMLPVWMRRQIGPRRQGLRMGRKPNGRDKMIPDRDIWRAANFLIRKHVADAEIVADRRVDEMRERGDHDGRIVWLRIRQAIIELQAAPAGKPN
jgi:hypothetical protein